MRGLAGNQQREAENHLSPLLCLIPSLSMEIIDTGILAADLSFKLLCFLRLSLAFSECRNSSRTAVVVKRNKEVLLGFVKGDPFKLLVLPSLCFFP